LASRRSNAGQTLVKHHKADGNHVTAALMAPQVQIRCKSGANQVQIRCNSGANQVQIRCKSGESGANRVGAKSIGPHSAPPSPRLLGGRAGSAAGAGQTLVKSWSKAGRPPVGVPGGKAGLCEPSPVCIMGLRGCEKARCDPDNVKWT
jgi:hypothetical protein